MHAKHISNLNADNNNVEAYAQLFNAQPIVLLSSWRGRSAFLVGHIDSAMRFHEYRGFNSRTEAYREFASLCDQWAAKD